MLVGEPSDQPLGHGRNTLYGFASFDFAFGFDFM
jgi:hypothetical protein